LPGFDFKNGIYYVNVGQDATDERVWEDCRKYGFLAAGQDKKWSDQIRTLNKDDIVVAYLKNHGYVGVGRVIHKAVPAKDFIYKDKKISELPLMSKGLLRNKDNEKCDYLVSVSWLKTVPQEQAYWKSKSGLFTTQLVKASLQDQPKTIDFLREVFEITFK
jgi:phage gp29-like protein